MPARARAPRSVQRLPKGLYTSCPRERGPPQTEGSGRKCPAPGHRSVERRTRLKRPSLDRNPIIQKMATRAELLLRRYPIDLPPHRPLIVPLRDPQSTEPLHFPSHPETERRTLIRLPNTDWPRLPWRDPPPFPTLPLDLPDPFGPDGRIPAELPVHVPLPPVAPATVFSRSSRMFSPSGTFKV